MARGKRFPLSIVLRTVDRSTAGLRRVGARLRGLMAPIRAVSGRFRSMARSAGLPLLARDLRRVGRSARGLATSIGAIATAAGLGVAGIKRIIAEGDNLAKRADRLGLTVDAYAQLRFAAGQAGVETSKFENAMDGLAKRVGEAKAGTGSLVTFLDKASPALLKQVKAAKNTEEAFDLMVVAISKVEDPTKRAALASSAFGRAGQSLLNLFADGPQGVRKLREEYFELAGSQEEAARKSEKMTDAMGRVSAATSGIKASILSGIAPAFLEITEDLKVWIVLHRDAIGEWVRDFGRRLPGRLRALVAWFRRVGQAITPVWDAIGGASGAAKILAEVISSKLIVAFVALARAMLLTPFGLIITAAGLIVAAWDPITKFFKDLWNGVVGFFEAAWKKIQDIVEKAKDAAKTILGIRESGGSDRIRKLAFKGKNPFEKFSGRATTERPSLGLNTPAGAAAPVPVARSDAHVTVEVSGLPPGSRVDVDPRSTADVDTTTGVLLGAQ